MRNFMFIATAAASLTAQPVLAKGCIRGAAVGAVAGHYVGKGHAAAGAAIGCAVAHHHYAKQARAERNAANHRG